MGEVPIKHLVTVTMKAEKGAPEEFYFGRFLRETDGKGRRKGIEILVKNAATTDVMSNKTREILYLDKERTDKHKEYGWRGNFFWTIIDNGVLVSNNGSGKTVGDIKHGMEFSVLEAQNKALKVSLTEMIDFIEEVGAYRLIDKELERWRALKSLVEEKNKDDSSGGSRIGEEKK